MHQATRAAIGKVGGQGAIFHTSKLLSIASIFTQDWVALRCILAASAVGSALFHYVFPDPRPARIAYAILFFFGHLGALAFFLYSKADALWPIDNDEMRGIYETHFKRHGVSQWEFLTMLGLGGGGLLAPSAASLPPGRAEVRHVPAGTVVVAQDDPMESIFLVLAGSGWSSRSFRSGGALPDRPLLVSFAGEAAADELIREAQAEPVKGAKIITGLWFGEIYDKSDTAARFFSVKGNPLNAWRVNFTAETDMTLLAVPKRRLQSFVEGNAHVQAALDRVQLADLWLAKRTTAVENLRRRVLHREEMKAADARAAALAAEVAALRAQLAATTPNDPGTSQAPA